MLTYVVFPILSLVGAFLTVYFTGIHHAFGILLFVGYLALLGASLFLFAIIASPLFPKNKEITRPNRFARFIVVEIYRVAIIFMQVHVKVTGHKHVPKKGTTFLLVSNHLSNYDHMIMLTRLAKFPISFISKPENFNIPVVGRYLYHAGFLAIDRKNARNALYTVNETARRISDCGLCYGVFPEGTRSRTGELLPFHSGVFLSAKKAGAGILVVHMDGTDRVPRRAPWLPTRVKMDILEYMTPEYVAEHTDKEICAHTYDLMLATGQPAYKRPERSPREPANTSSETERASDDADHAETPTRMTLMH